MNKNMEQIKLNLMKVYLQENNIAIPDNINNIKELKKYLTIIFANNKKDIVKNMFLEVDKYFNNVLKELKSNTTPSNMVKIRKNITPLTNAVLSTLAINTILNILPTVELKVMGSLAIVLKNTYQLNKSIKYRNILNKEYEVTKILHELEITKDQDGRILDTRFDITIINYIKEFLTRNSITYTDGYLSLRNCLEKLDYEHKLSLINLINNLTGNKIDIEKRLNKYQDTLKSKIQSGIIKPLTIGGGLGIGLATTINAIDPSITAGLYNGTIIGNIINTLSNNKSLGWISGILGGIATKLMQYIPIIGEGLENIIARENLIITTIITSIAYLIYYNIKKILHIFTYLKVKRQDKENYREYLRIDHQKYNEDNKKEYLMLQELRKHNTNSKDNLIMIIIIKYLKENNIIVPDDITSLSSLKYFISNLSKHNQGKVLKILNKLESLNHSKYQNFVKTLSSLGHIAYVGIILSLGSLSIIDLLIDNDFLENLGLKLFPNSLKKYDLIKNTISNENMFATCEQAQVTPKPTPTPTPTPAPTKTPSPLPGPAPDANLNIYVPKKTNVYLQEFLNNPNFIKELNQKSGKEIYEIVSSLQEYRFIGHCNQSMDINALIKLIDYINNNNNINRNSLLFSFFRDSINERIGSINAYVDMVRKHTKITSSVLGTSNLLIENSEIKNKQKVKTR